jgi:hypothetical protein
MDGLCFGFSLILLLMVASAMAPASTPNKGTSPSAVPTNANNPNGATASSTSSGPPTLTQPPNTPGVAPKGTVSSSPTPTAAASSNVSTPTSNSNDDRGLMAALQDVLFGPTNTPKSSTSQASATTATKTVSSTSKSASSTLREVPLPPDVQTSIAGVLAEGLTLHRNSLAKGRRPFMAPLTPVCKREYDFRFFVFPRLTPLQYYGFGPKGLDDLNKKKTENNSAPSSNSTVSHYKSNTSATKTNSSTANLLASAPETIEDLLRQGALHRVNLSALEKPDLQMLETCSALTLPQLIYLLLSKRLAYLSDACLFSIDKTLWRALPPVLVQRLFVLKPGTLIRLWRFIAPEVKALLPIVDAYVLRDPTKSFLCCSFHPSDFGHMNHLAAASSECLLNMLAPIKCSRIQPDFWTSSPMNITATAPGLPILDLERLNLVTPIDRLPELVSSSKNHPIPSETDEKVLLARLLDRCSLSCYDAMPVATRLALFARIQHLKLQSGDIVVGRQHQVAQDIQGHPDLAKRYGTHAPTQATSPDKVAADAYSQLSRLSASVSLAFFGFILML